MGKASWVGRYALALFHCPHIEYTGRTGEKGAREGTGTIRFSPQSASLLSSPLLPPSSLGPPSTPASAPSRALHSPHPYLQAIPTREHCAFKAPHFATTSSLTLRCLLPPSPHQHSQTEDEGRKKKSRYSSLLPLSSVRGVWAESGREGLFPNPSLPRLRLFVSSPRWGPSHHLSLAILSVVLEQDARTDRCFGALCTGLNAGAQTYTG